MADDWLAILYDHVKRPGIGIVGAMGSYESLQSSIELISVVTTGCKNYRIPYDPIIDSYYGFITKVRCKRWRLGKVTLEMRILRTLQRAFNRTVAMVRRKVSTIERASEFARFPNPHIRSNGFMVHRDWMDELKWHPIVTKQDACLFESGDDSLTNRIRRQGLRAVVVDKHGSAFDLPFWCKARHSELPIKRTICYRIIRHEHSRPWIVLRESLTLA